MASDLQPFDWGRMFLGNLSPLFLLEIFFRTIFMYVVALAAARVIGKRGMGQLTPFEYIVVIALGSNAGSPMMEVGIPLLHGMAVLISVVAIDTLLARWASRTPAVARVLESAPAHVIRSGEIQEEMLLREKMGQDEFKMMLRLHGVREMSEVEHAFLEPSGDLSVFLFAEEAEKDEARPGKQEEKAEREEERTQASKQGSNQGSKQNGQTASSTLP